MQRRMVGEKLIEVDAVAKLRRLEILVQKFHIVVGKNAVHIVRENRIRRRKHRRRRIRRSHLQAQQTLTAERPSAEIVAELSQIGKRWSARSAFNETQRMVIPESRWQPSRTLLPQPSALLRMRSRPRISDGGNVGGQCKQSRRQRRRAKGLKNSSADQWIRHPRVPDRQIINLLGELTTNGQKGSKMVPVVLPLDGRAGCVFRNCSSLIWFSAICGTQGRYEFDNIDN